MQRYALRVSILLLCAIAGFAAGAKKGFIEPAEPQWGQTIRLIYRADLPGAELHANDSATAIVYIWYPGRNERWRVPMTRAGDRLEASMSVPDQASYVSAWFVTRDASGGPAYTMIYNTEGKPARGAWHQSMLQPSIQRDYRERAARELALYPDNWEVYRDKWFAAGVFEMAEREFMIRDDLAKINARSVEALYSVNYGRLLLGDEPAARSTLSEMVDRFPGHSLTANAIHSYEYENFDRHFTGDGPKQVRQWLVEFNQRNPGGDAARSGLDSLGAESLPVETVEAICLGWIKDDPANPKPYLYLAQAYQRAHTRPADALAHVEKALDLLAAGELRLHGDIYGKMTDLLLPSAFCTAADIALENRQYAKALAYAKAAENTGTQTMPQGFAAEARVWEALGRGPNSAAALKEAWHRGDRKTAPAFHATSLDGREIDSAKLRGKVVVANFWFTGCGPCKAEIPDLNRLTREFAGKDVVFLAFTLDEDETVLRRFLKEIPFEYSIVPSSGKIHEQFGIGTYPSHVIVGPDGTIESMLVGGGERRAEELKTIIARLAPKP